MKSLITTAFAVVMLSAIGNTAFAADANIQFHNMDSSNHTIQLDRANRIIQVYPQSMGGTNTFSVPSGGSATTTLTPGSWAVYGNGQNRFHIIVNPNSSYDFTLQPFSQNSSYGTNYGLLGVINDGYNNNSYLLYELAQVPPPIPSPPVVIVEQPSYYYPAPYRYDKGRALGEAIGSAVFDILGEALSDDHRRRRW